MSDDPRTIARRIVADVFDRAPSPRVSASAAAARHTEDRPPRRATSEEPAEATDVTARIVAEVLAARAEGSAAGGEQPAVQAPDADGPPPSPATAVIRDERVEPDPGEQWTRLIAPDRGPRTGRWLLALVVAVLGLAVLVPLAIVALQQLFTGA
ncbi:MAG: hypothetical protein ACOCT8_00820 [Actinomycetota bacterium]